MLLGDFGTSFTKILDTETGERRIAPTREARAIRADLATGHNAALHAEKTVGELLAMARGGQSLIGPDFHLLDIGSRDMKYLHIRDGRVIRMDWNAQCGAMTGFTLELMGNYFDLDFSKVKPSEKDYPMTCGVLGLERAFDDMAQGLDPEEALARFARGLAISAHRFIGRPDKFHLSGGMCDNPLFLKSFPEGVEVITAGRFVLIDGLLAEVGADCNFRPNRNVRDG